MSDNRQSLVLPSSKREVLLLKINEFKTGNLNVRDLGLYNELTGELSIVFKKICWSKLGISYEQLKKLNQQDLEELAEMIYERSRVSALIQTGIWACIPIVGWLVLYITLSELDNGEPMNVNIRYYWWYRRMKNKFGKNFKPSIC